MTKPNKRVQGPKLKDVYSVPALTAFEHLAAFCLVGPNASGRGFASRTVGSVAVSVELKESTGVFEDPTDSWISRVRINNEDNPFDEKSGVEIWLPTGQLALNGAARPELFVSLPGDGIGWHGHDIHVGACLPTMAAGDLAYILRTHEIEIPFAETVHAAMLERFAVRM